MCVFSYYGELYLLFLRALCFFLSVEREKILNARLSCSPTTLESLPAALGGLPRRRQEGLRGNPSKHKGGEEGEEPFT